jgi:hypothetical protein
MKFVVIGTGRCGTSFLRDTLNNHPDCYVCSESYWHIALLEKYGTGLAPVENMLADIRAIRFHDGRSTLDANLRLVGGPLPDFLDEIAAAWSGRMGSVRDTCSSIENALLKLSGKTVFGDKTPHYGFHLPELRLLWPNLKVVHVVRDGRPCAISMSKHGGYQLLAALGVDDWTSVSRFADQLLPQPPVTDLDVYLEMWGRQATRIASSIRSLPAATSLTVHYEAMLESPMTFFGRVAAFLELGNAPMWLDASSAGVTQPAGRLEGLEKLRPGAAAAHALQIFGYDENARPSLTSSPRNLARRVKDAFSRKMS